jgi:hypothetical protein
VSKGDGLESGLAGVFANEPREALLLQGALNGADTLLPLRMPK